MTDNKDSVRTSTYRNKEKTTINLPKELKKKAKEEGINLSKTLENALIAKLDPENASSFLTDFFASKKIESPGRELNARV